MEATANPPQAKRLPVVDVKIPSEWYGEQPSSQAKAANPDRYTTTIKAKQLPEPPAYSEWGHGPTRIALDVSEEAAADIEPGDVIATPRRGPVIPFAPPNPGDAPAVFDVIQKGYRPSDNAPPGRERLWVVESREQGLPAHTVKRAQRIRDGIGRRDPSVPHLRYVGVPESEPAAAA